MKTLSLERVKEARENLKGIINKTDLYYSDTFSKMSNNKIYMKAENLQKTGSFKIRGAYNKIRKLCSEERNCGVIASSAGNHAQGVALAANKNNIQANIVMPLHAPLAKVAATKSYGANVILYGETYDETYQKALELQEKSGATFIHPFNDIDVISGQGTIALEILEQLPETDIIVVPIGGGGLISGIAFAVKELYPNIKVIGVEANKAASMKKSITEGRLSTLESVSTIADGISVKTPGEITYAFCKKYVDDIVTVDDEEICSAILILLERSKMIVEGAGATALAAVLNNKLSCKDKVIVPVLSGGNIDVNIVSRIIERALIKAGRKYTIKTCIQDKPGCLSQLVSEVASLDVNIISINHKRYQPDVAIDYSEVDIEIETKNTNHAGEICAHLENKGYVLK
ncbi:threonine ammonia-lyase [Natronospora cellulosivora (SeqCode)]